MAATTDGVHPEPGPDADIDELRADIDRTRHELGETVSALADKADVKAQFAKRTEAVSQTVKRNPGVDAAVVIGVAALVGLFLWARRRHR